MTNEEGKGKGTVVFDLRLVHKGGGGGGGGPLKIKKKKIRAGAPPRGEGFVPAADPRPH